MPDDRSSKRAADAKRRRFQPLTEFLEKADLNPLQFLQLLLRGEAPRVVEIAGELKVCTSDVTAWIVRQECRAQAGIHGDEAAHG